MGMNPSCAGFKPSGMPNQAIVGDNQDQIFFSFTLPIGSGQQLSDDAQHDKNSGYSQNISYFNSQDPRNIWRVSAGGVMIAPFGTETVKTYTASLNAIAGQSIQLGQFDATAIVKINDY